MTFTYHCSRTENSLIEAGSLLEARVSENIEYDSILGIPVALHLF